MQRRLIAGTINLYPAGDGWENVHLDKSDRKLWDGNGNNASPDIVADISDLSGVIGDEEFDEIRCWQVLEHLWQNDARSAIQEFRRILRIGATLDIEVPDIDKTINAWVNGRYSHDKLLHIIYGDNFEMPDQQLNAHRYGYTEETLTNLLVQNGFFDVIRRDDDIESLQLHLVAVRAS